MCTAISFLASDCEKSLDSEEKLGFYNDETIGGK